MASITNRGNSYRISVSCGYDSSNKKILKTMTYTPAPGMKPKLIEKEVQRQAMIFEEKCKTGQVLDSNTKFDEFSKKWFEDYAEKQLKKTTVSRYHDLMKRITPAIGHIKLDKLQPHHLLEFYSNLEENGVRADIKYTPCNNFKEILNKKNMTYKQLSEKAKVSIATVKSCTTGKNITCKSAEFISKASPRVLVVPDYTHIMIDDEVNYVEEKEDEQGITYYDVTKRKYYEVGGALNSFDGQGVASPDWVEQIAKNELGLDYTPSAMNVRCIGVKGLLVTFPFKEMAKDDYMVANLKGDVVDIRNYDVILTESQWKYHDLYDDDFNTYEKAHTDNKFG